MGNEKYGWMDGVIGRQAGWLADATTLSITTFNIMTLNSA
jgi:hypothetical protein